MLSNRTRIAITALVVTGLFLAASSTNSLASKASPQGDPTPARLSTEGLHGTHEVPIDTRALGFGMSVEASIQVAKVLQDPQSETLVRPISLNVKFMHGLGLLSSLHALKLLEPGSTELVEYKTFGLDPSLMDASLEGVEGRPRGYRLTFQPKSGSTWGTVRGVWDTEFLAYPIE